MHHSWNHNSNRPVLEINFPAEIQDNFFGTVWLLLDIKFQYKKFQFTIQNNNNISQEGSKD